MYSNKSLNIFEFLQVDVLIFSVDISITFLTGLDIDGEYSIISVGFKLSNGVAPFGKKELTLYH
jgi:hypothetical protein